MQPILSSLKDIRSMLFQYPYTMPFVALCLTAVYLFARYKYTRTSSYQVRTYIFILYIY